MILQETSSDLLTLTHLGNGENIRFSGVFARRLEEFLHSPEGSNAPILGSLLEQHPWLQQLNRSMTTPPSKLLLGSGLGMLFVELTDRCNESCIHCYAESSPQRSASLTRGEIGNVLQQARALGHPAVQFTGGDPLLHADLVFGVEMARQLDFAVVEIYTNGLALSRTLLDKLVPYRPAFSFSIYAADASIHDRITQHPGSLARTLKAMRRVQDAGLPLRVGIILMPENKGTEDATIAFLQNELGLDAGQIGIDVVRSTGRGAFMRDYRPDMSRLKQFRHNADSPPNTDIETGSTKTDRTDIPLRRGKLCVAASGDVFPCIFSRRVKLGNIRRKSLPEIIDGLAERSLASPSEERWQHCRESLSCSDCQAIAYLLENDAIPIRPAHQGDSHAIA